MQNALGPFGIPWEAEGRLIGGFRMIPEYIESEGWKFELMRNCPGCGSFRPGRGVTKYMGRISALQKLAAGYRRISWSKMLLVPTAVYLILYSAGLDHAFLGHVQWYITRIWYNKYYIDKMRVDEWPLYHKVLIMYSCNYQSSCGATAAHPHSTARYQIAKFSSLWARILNLVLSARS